MSWFRKKDDSVCIQVMGDVLCVILDRPRRTILINDESILATSMAHFYYNMKTLKISATKEEAEK